VFLAEPLVLVYMFPPWLSATCIYNTFVNILRADIKIIERVRSKYKVAKYNINTDIPSLTARILVIISPSSLVLSKASRLLLYPSIYLLRVLASIVIILIFF
jgi:hypothetical protein